MDSGSMHDEACRNPSRAGNMNAVFCIPTPCPQPSTHFISSSMKMLLANVRMSLDRSGESPPSLWGQRKIPVALAPDSRLATDHDATIEMQFMDGTDRNTTLRFFSPLTYH